MRPKLTFCSYFILFHLILLYNLLNKNKYIMAKIRGSRISFGLRLSVIGFLRGIKLISYSSERESNSCQY